MLYIIASTYRAAQDFCYEMHLDATGSKYVCILTQGYQVRGIRLQPNDGYEYVIRDGDHFDNDLILQWQYVLDLREAKQPETR